MSIKINNIDVITNNIKIDGQEVKGTTDLSFGGGTAATRPGSPVAGDIRYNSSVSKIEVYSGTEWRYLEYLYEPAGTVGLFVGGSGSDIDIQELNLLGSVPTNTTKTGELTIGRQYLAAAASSTRAIFAGGNSPTLTNFSTIDYVEFGSGGNATFFGFLSETRRELSGCSNDTYAHFGGGYTPGWSTRIDRVTIATTGNSTNYGYLSDVRIQYGACASPTRGYFGGGYENSPGPSSVRNTIDSLSFTSGGAAADFGDLTQSRAGVAAASNPVRGLFAGGTAAGDFNLASGTNIIDYITFESTGASTDFGDLTQSRTFLASCSTPTKGFFAGGRLTNPGHPTVNTIDSVSFQSNANATDFGDLNSTLYGLAGTSNAHGGLGTDPGYTSTTLTGDIGIFAGGEVDSYLEAIDYVSLSSGGSTSTFGELTIGRKYLASAASSIRGLIAGGTSPTLSNFGTIDYVTIASTGNAEFFGFLTQYRHGLAGLNSPTRAVFGGGSSPGQSNVMDYVTIATEGNATDFGDLSYTRTYLAGCSSGTRGVFAGGWRNYSPGNSVRNEIDYITIASTGNATDFGDLTQSRAYLAAAGNYSRGLFAGGDPDSNLSRTPSTNTIDMITFSALGASSDFGDLTSGRSYLDGTSSSTEAFFSGGTQGPGTQNTVIEKVAFDTKANTTSFGTLSRANRHHTSTSNVNGGLGVVPPSAGTDLTTSGTAVFAGGTDNYDSIQYLNLNSASNTVEFGELSIGRSMLGAHSNTTRAIFAGGNSPTLTNFSNIDYVTLATAGNSEFFGSLSQARRELSGTGNATHALFGGGLTPGWTARIDKVTMASLGNGVNYGSLSDTRSNYGACASPTRGYFGGGYYSSPGPTVRNTIDSESFTSAGITAADFGDLTQSRAGLAACSNPLRGIFGGGTAAGDFNMASGTNIIDYITFESTGASTDFGDLTQSRTYLSSCSTPTKGFFAGGRLTSPGHPSTNVIDTVNFQNNGNATDFGDLAGARYQKSGTSNSHGGLDIDPGYTSTTLTGNIAIFAGGESDVYLEAIDYMAIASGGATSTFGELTIGRKYLASAASSTRGLIAGGTSPTLANFGTIDYITIASTGNSEFFGFLTQYRHGFAGLNSDTRAVFGGGSSPGQSNVIDYVTIATAGNATDFGDLSYTRTYLAACSSGTRGVFGGGWRNYSPGNSVRNEIDYITIATAGNAADFGDLTQSRAYLGAASNSLRGLFAGGDPDSNLSRTPSTNIIDYITFQSTGASTDFGDLTSGRSYLDGTSSSTEAFFSGGTQGPGTQNTVIEKVSFVSNSNAASFGTLSRANRHHTSTSNANGGLGADPGYTSTTLTGDIGIFAGGEADSYLEAIDYVSLSSGGSTSTFGEMTIGRKYLASAASSTRGLIAGGTSPTLANFGTIDYITIASTGNSEFFGFLSQYRHGFAGLNSPTRAVFGGGSSPGQSNVMDYVTIATAGNATDFGDLSYTRTYLAACSSGTRGVFAGGWRNYTPGNSVRNEIDYITIATTGNATDFGDLTQSRAYLAAAGNYSRGLFAGGDPDSNLTRTPSTNTIDMITFSALGASSDFGDLTSGRSYLDGTSSSTEAFFSGGTQGPGLQNTVIEKVGFDTKANTTSFGTLSRANRHHTSTSNVNGGLGVVPPSAGTDLTTSGTAVFAGGTDNYDSIQYVNLNSASNSVEFGELSIGRSMLGAHSNTTRAIFAGGYSPTLAAFSNIDYVTLATAGNSEFFGSLSEARRELSGTGDATYALFGGGMTPGWSTRIDRVDMTSLGDGTNYGYLSDVRNNYGACASPTRGYFGGGYENSPGPSSVRNTIDSLSFSSGGAASDFGDLTQSRAGLAACSNPLRGIFGGGTAAGDFNMASGTNIIDYITFESTGASTDFGDLIQSRTYLSSASTPTKGFFAGGRLTSPGHPSTNVIDTVNFESNGSASDFGDLVGAKYQKSGTSNSHGGLDIDPGYTSTTLTGDIAIFAGGESDVYLEAIDYMAIASGGSTSTFGEMTIGRKYLASAASSTRGLIAGGTSPTLANFGTIDYITIASTGNSEFFGFLSQYRHGFAGLNSSTRAVFGGGSSPGQSNVMDYVTIATAGNATDFGDLSYTRTYLAACSSGTRGVFAGGWRNYSPGNSVRNEIDYITIASTGNATDFGDLTQSRAYLAAAGNYSRGLFAGGDPDSNLSRTPSTNTIDMITFSALGASSDFGDLTSGRSYLDGTSSSTEAFFSGGTQGPGTQNTVIEKVGFDTKANTTSFGTLSRANRHHTSTSNANGGLGVVPPSAGVDLTTSGTAVFAGGTDNYDSIQYLNLNSLSNSVEFGELSIGRSMLGAHSNTTRAIFAGGYSPTLAAFSNIDYVTLATAGNSEFFGSLSEARRELSGTGDATYALFGGGMTPGWSTRIDKVTMASLGNGVSYGSLSDVRIQYGACASPTRGYFGGGYENSPGPSSVRNTIDSESFASAGISASDFGDLTQSRAGLSACSNPLRGLFAGGTAAGDFNMASGTNIVDYITFESTGASTDFGDLTQSRTYLSSASTPTKGFFAGGRITSPGHPSTNVIDTVNFQNNGNATDFGDLAGARYQKSGTSNSHGGLNIDPGYTSTTLTGDIAIFAGGESDVYLEAIDYMAIASGGATSTFGELTIGRKYLASAASSTRGLITGGTSPTLANFGTIDYITIASTGNSEFFGFLTQYRHGLAGLNSSTRAVFGGGSSPGQSNVIDYVTIATAGNATDFGDLSYTRTYLAACSSGTRGVFGGGWRNYSPGNSVRNEIDYITIASTGNAADFGDLTQSRAYLGAASNSLRGLFAGGDPDSNLSRTPSTNIIDYITFESTGASSDFGDLTSGRSYLDGTSSSTEAFFSGGTQGPGLQNTVIEKVSFVSNSNAASFGTLSRANRHHTSTSNANGGLGADPGYTSTTLSGDIAIFAGGESDVYLEAIDYMAIASGGSTSTFGEMTIGRKYLASAASSTRGLITGGTSPTLSNFGTIDYVTIASTGNSEFFGFLTQYRHGLAGLNSDTRAVFGGGSSPGQSNVIDYVTIATAGNATDFGDLSYTRTYLAACSSGTRGVFAGGWRNYTPGNSVRNEIDYITIATTGNAADFGDLTQSRAYLAAAGNYSRGLFAGGDPDSNLSRTPSTNTIDMITFSALGASSDFGDLTSGRSYLDGTSSSTEAFFSGGTQGPGTQNTVIEKVSFDTKANTTSFGTLSRANRHHTSTSNANGGLGVVPPSAGVNLTTSGTAVFAGGTDNYDSIQYLNLNSASNSVEFGELSIGRSMLGAHSNTTRAIFAGGYSPTLAAFSNIDYVTLATAGNSEFFGSLSETRRELSGTGDATYALFGGGMTPGWSTRVDRVDMTSLGNGTNYGSLSDVRIQYGACASPTRGYFGGGYENSPGPSSVRNTIDSLSFSSGGAASDFGDLTQSRAGVAACSNPLRGIFGGGTAAGDFNMASGTNIIDYITFESTGASTDFGNLTQSRTYLSSASTPTKGFFAGGRLTNPGHPSTNVIDTVNFVSIGNATDFGDLTGARYQKSGTSNSHGGLNIDPGYTTTALSGDIGLFAGGNDYLSDIQYFDIASLGNTTTFGELTIGRELLGAAASSTRAIFAGGNSPTLTNHSTIDYVTIASAGNAEFFGFLSETRRELSGCSNDTYAHFGGGMVPGWSTRIDRVTIGSLGNSTNYGYLSDVRIQYGACASPTRGYFGGGYENSPGPSSVRNTIDSLSFTSSGAAADFGDLTQSRAGLAAASNPVRGLFAGGTSAGNFDRNSGTNIIDYITFESSGASTDFGDLTQSRTYLAGTSSPTRAVFAGGQRPTPNNVTTQMDYVSFESKSNATTFGSLSNSYRDHAGTSEVHGGLNIDPGYTSSTLSGDIGLFAGGNDYLENIQYFDIASTGNTSVFGELTIGRELLGAAASSTRAIFAGGNSPTLTNFSTIDYVTIASTGNAEFFGFLSETRRELSGCSNDTYAHFGGGMVPGWSTRIDRVTIATTGNSTNYGSLSDVRIQYGACASPTRGYFGGGYENTPTPSSVRNTIDSLSFTSGGAASDFGDLTQSRAGLAAASNPVRGLFAGGTSAGNFDRNSGTNIIDYITFESSGASTDFGDLTQSRTYLAGTSSPTRAVFAGGQRPTPSNVTTQMDYVSFDTRGNAATFGSLIRSYRDHAGTSNVHGGLGIDPGYTPTTLTGEIGVFGGGDTNSSTMEYVNIATTSGTTRFGDLAVGREYLAACASSTRGLFAGGSTPTNPNTVKTIDYITIAATSYAFSFGDLTQGRYSLAGCNSSTRGVFGGGRNPGINNYIDYVTIASTGNATDFGDLTETRSYIGSCSSPTRGLFAGGYLSGPNRIRNIIDYITIASAGNATDFGDLIRNKAMLAGCSSSTRGLFGGGTSSANLDNSINDIDYVTIASTGNATDFGDLTTSHRELASCSGSTRGLFAGGRLSPGPNTNVIGYVTIASTGNASSFGTLSSSSRRKAGLSNSNGGV